MPSIKITACAGAFALCAFLPLAAAAQGGSALGVPNFHVVNDHVLRGGQPTAQGWKTLAGMGVTTVLDLCDGDSPSGEPAAVAAAGMKYVSIPMSGHGISEPSVEKVERALAVLDKADGIVYVHCHKGSDRTGTVIACYRIEHDHWAPAKAQKEADNYGMSWLNVGMKRYISRYSGDAAATATAPAVAAPAPALAADAVATAGGSQ